MTTRTRYLLAGFLVGLGLVAALYCCAAHAPVTAPMRDYR